jgi:UDP:flavonoid glycosyltransferase YjiC (YdhE family)
VARFLVATMPIPGHLAPFTPVVRRLTGAGHEVVWYGSAHHRSRIEQTGARFAPMDRAIDYGDGDYNRYFPQRARKKGLRQVIHDFDVMFVGQLPYIIDDLVDLEKSFEPDVLMHDPAIPGALVERLTGVPGAQLNITVPAFKWPGVPPFGLGLPFADGPIGRLRDRLAFQLVDRVVFRRPNATYRQIAQTRGWPVHPVRPILSEHLNLQPSVPEMDYPVAPWPDTLHFIGPLPPETGPFTPPRWWDELLDVSRRVVLVTQGTVAIDPTQLIIPALRALADTDVLVIAATGGPGAADLGIEVPANAHVEPFIPFGKLMPHVDAYVTNGGFGGVSIALSHGVPVVVGGRTEDKAEVAARLAHSGAGINLRTQHPSPARLRQAVRRVLDDEGYRTRAGQIRRSMAAHDAPAEAAHLLERLAEQRP